METRLIYKASDYLKSKVSWIETTPGNPWAYFGNGNEIIKEFVLENIEQHFANDNALYIAWTRNESFQAQKKDIEEKIKEILGVHDFFIWNTNFTKTMEFSKNGVMRRGLLST